LGIVASERGCLAAFEIKKGERKTRRMEKVRNDPLPFRRSLRVGGLGEKRHKSSLQQDEKIIAQKEYGRNLSGGDGPEEMVTENNGKRKKKGVAEKRHCPPKGKSKRETFHNLPPNKKKPAREVAKDRPVRTISLFGKKRTLGPVLRADHFWARTLKQNDLLLNHESDGRGRGVLGGTARKFGWAEE